MNNFDKIRVVAYKNGLPVGYVKSVSYKNGTYTLIQEKMLAKTYTRQEKAMDDIDAIAVVGLRNGVTFGLA